MSGETILLVSAAEGNVSVLVEFLTEHDYQAYGAKTLDELDEMIDEKSLDAVLIDPDGFETGIWERCERLRQQGTPFFVVSKHGTAAESKGQKYQAMAIFEKPLARDALLKTIGQLTSEE